MATAQISASAVCARAQPWKAGGHNIVEQISSNLSVLVPGPSGGKAALLCPPLPVPPISPVYPSQCQHTARRMRCQQGGAAVWGVSSCRGPGPSVDRSCVLSAGRRFALERRSGAEKSWHRVFLVGSHLHPRGRRDFFNFNGVVIIRVRTDVSFFFLPGCSK